MKKHLGSSYIITPPNLHVVRRVNCPNLDPCLSGLIQVYRLWGDESMQKAIAAVEQGGASICHAAEKVWYTTFHTFYTAYLPLAIGMFRLNSFSSDY